MGREFFDRARTLIAVNLLKSNITPKSCKLCLPRMRSYIGGVSSEYSTISGVTGYRLQAVEDRGQMGDVVIEYAHTRHVLPDRDALWLDCAPLAARRITAFQRRPPARP